MPQLFYAILVDILVLLKLPNQRQWIYNKVETE